MKELLAKFGDGIRSTERSSANEMEELLAIFVGWRSVLVPAHSAEGPEMAPLAARGGQNPQFPLRPDGVRNFVYLLADLRSRLGWASCYCLAIIFPRLANQWYILR